VTSVPRVALAVVSLVALLLGWVTPVRSHAYLVRSSPAARAVVARAPERVQLWFNERLEPAYSRLSVWNGQAERVDAGDVQVAAAEPTRLSVSVPPLPAGAYTVKYRVLSVDGHVVEAEFGFTVRGAS
jgi:methionine-rich copper-binding protein CopC